MGYNLFRSGDHASICDVCGFRFYGSELRKRWDGLMVCKEDYEERQPQDYLVRAKKDKQKIDNARPEPDYNYLSSPSKGEDL